MYYLALLIGPERARTPEEGAQEMVEYQNFHAKAASAIHAGDALFPVAEVAGGYYVLEAENLDDALTLARDIPEAKHGAVEVWPLIHCSQEFDGQGATNWLALLIEPRDEALLPGTPEWEAVADKHGAFRARAGDHIKLAGPLHPRRPRPRYGYVTARCCSPTAPTSRGPRSRTVSTY